MAHAWDDGGKEVDRTEVLEAPAASEEDSAEDRAEVLEALAVLVEYSAMARAEVLDASVASEEDMVMDRVEVSEVSAVSEKDSVEERAEVSEAPAASEEHREEDRVEVSEASVVSGGDSVVALVLVPAVSGGDRGMVPAFVAYRTDSTENRAAGTVLAEVLAASAVGLACAYDHRRYPA